ncbi:hypothetical protein [Sedimentibacter sp.]|uniref:hypothetical protein n=1 Tax=Sedimentibacter sp. TaxID=1960295 RepID=UPI0028AC7A85|nr:hypothetical protein [Sedimentibacter sp.]
MNIYNKTVTILLVIFEAILIFTGFTALLQKDYEVFKLSLLAIFSILIPFILSLLAKKKKLNLPLSFQLFGIIFIFTAQYFGEIKNFYDYIWWWDLMLHGAFGSYMVITFLHLIKGIIRREIDITRKRYVMATSLFAFSFAVTLGTLWEIFEFSGDFMFNTGMVKGGLEDTMSDLIVKTTAALVTSSIYYFRKRNE